ncbi:MAG: hypothetical protein DMG09_11640, partial [Acidobacteria bacterium]
MNPLHIAFFNRSFYPDTAATGQLLTELCEGLQADGNGFKRGRLFQRQQHKGIEIIRARGTRFSKRRFPGRFSNYVSYFLCACYGGIHLDPPDIVVALTDPPIIGLAAYLASRRYGARFVMSFRDVFPEVARLLEDFQSEIVNGALYRTNRFLVRKADRIVALGDTMRRKLIEGKGADAARTLIVPGPKRNPFSIAHGLADKFVVMHSGNIGLSQGLETVIDAAALLKGFPDIEFVFVGEGVKKAALADQARALGLGNVRFLPYQPQDRLSESFATADVFIVSLKPGLAGYIVPSKLYGILAAGRPYVAMVETECEVADIAGKRECGLLAEPGNPTDLAGKIVSLHNDRA